MDRPHGRTTLDLIRLPPKGAHRRRRHRRLHLPRELARPLLAFLTIILIGLLGTLGFHTIEGTSYFDAFYFTVITVGTIGYGELPNMTTEGRMLVILLVMLSVLLLSFAVASLTQFLVSGTIVNIMGLRKMTHEIEKLSGHFIVCGLGRLGSTIALQLERAGKPFVIIEPNEEKCRAAQKRRWFVVQGDATMDETLADAGIERAEALIVVTAEDAMNTYIILSARTLSPSIRIITRAVGDGAEKRLRLAGADQVVSPIERGAVHIAQTALRPAVVDFIDLAAAGAGDTFQLEEILVPMSSPMLGRSLRELDIANRHEVMIVAIRRAHTGVVEFNPRAASEFHPEDVLIAMGRMDRLVGFERALSGVAAP